MRDFRISNKVAAGVAVALTIGALISYFAALALITHYVSLECCTSIRAKAYSLSALIAFGTTSLFYARKVYLILFRNSELLGQDTSPYHNLPFTIYVLLRPAFGVIVSIIFLFGIEHLIRSAVEAPVLSHGFVDIGIVSAMLLSAVLGPAIDALPRAGKRLVSNLDKA